MAVATTLQTLASDELIARLSRIEAKNPTIVSCYLRLDQSSRKRDAYLVDLLNRIRDLEMTLEVRGLDRAGRKQVATELERLTRWLARRKNLPNAPGVAIFASTSPDLFEVVPLARVHRNRIDIDTQPLLEELIDAQETLGHYLAIAVDRSRARFFHVTASHTDELNALVPFAHRGGRFRPDRSDAPGVGEYRFHQRVLNEKNRHYSSVSREIERLMRARPYQGLAVFGPDAHTAAMAGFLTARQSALCLGVGRLNPTSVTPAEIGSATWALQGTAEERDEKALTRRVLDAVATGWGVNGTRQTLRALARGQVRTLVVPDGATGSGFRCRTTGELVETPAECRGGGEPVPVPHLVDHAIEDALRQRAEVIVIDDPKLASKIDGIAALLRFRAR